MDRHARGRRAALAAGIALAALPAAAAALPPDTWVIAVSSNKGDAEDMGLLYANRDAQQLVEALQTQGGVESRFTTVLANARADEVRDALHDVNAIIRERSTRTPTALVVYYSGHADADALHLSGTHLRLDELRKLVEGSPAATRILIVDACQSGSVTRVKGVRPADRFKIDLVQEPNQEGLAIITSSAAGETSHESDALRGSFFTHHLVNALRGAADENGDGVVTLNEAYAYTYAQTLRSSGRTLDLQHPTFAYDVKGRGELILSRPREARGEVGRLRLAEATAYLISERGEGGPVVAELASPRPGTLLSLPAGDYFVQERLPAEYREYRVHLAEGADVDLEALPYDSIEYDRLVRARGGPKLTSNELEIFGGAHGGVVEDEGTLPQVIVGYGVALPWFTAGVRVRGATVSSPGNEGELPRVHDEVGVGLTIERFIDFEWASLSFGVLAEATWQHQGFTGPRTAPALNALGGAFGGMVSVERQLGAGFALHAEGGPVTELFEEADVGPDGSIDGKSLASPFTWWAAGGIVWRW